MHWYWTNRGIALLFMLLTTSLKAQVEQGDYTDYHVHLQDSLTVQLGYRMLKAFGQAPTKMDSLALDADTIIERLNRANFKKAWILSNAYWYGSPLLSIENEYEEVKRQNDWIAEQSARYPERLTAFLSVNPLKPYALQEIQRCVDSRHFSGLKLHFANSRVNLFDKVQLARLQKVFALANKNRLVVLVHLRSESDWNGRANANILVKQLVPFAKQTKVVLAHLSGWGAFDQPTDDALTVLITHMRSIDSGRNNLYFDLSAVLRKDVHEGHQPATSKESLDSAGILAKQISQIGVDRVLFGTDWPLIDIDPYIKLLDSVLGSSTVQAILKNKINAN